jgi:hypothetical protein
MRGHSLPSWGGGFADAGNAGNAGNEFVPFANKSS